MRYHLDSDICMLGSACKNNSSKRCARAFFVLVCLIAGTANRKASAETFPSTGTAVVVEHNFAIADFDGDQRPDLASVHGGYDNLSEDYWIRFQLTSSQSESVRIVAPAGGLQLEARDVNGDHAVDLVVVSAWLSQPIAILLNDGHGSFSRVEAATFPEAFKQADDNWETAYDHGTEAVGAPPQSGGGDCYQVRLLFETLPRARWTSRSQSVLLLCILLTSHAGRAPPRLISYL